MYLPVEHAGPVEHAVVWCVALWLHHPTAYPIGRIEVYRHKRVMRQINGLHYVRKYTLGAYIARSDSQPVRSSDGCHLLGGPLSAPCHSMYKKAIREVWKEHFTFVEIARGFTGYREDYIHNYEYFYRSGVYKIGPVGRGAECGCGFNHMFECINYII